MAGSIRPGRRPDTWELRVAAGADPARPGRYRQVSRTVGPCSKRQADKHLADLVSEVNRGLHRDRTVATFAELLEQWLASAETAGRSPTTLREYRRIVDDRLVPALGDVQVGKLKVQHFDRLYAELHDRGLSPSSINQTHAVARRALNQGITWGWLATNPTRGTTRPAMRRARVKPPTVPELLAVVAAAHEQDPGLAVLLQVAAGTGARRGELCGLQWGDVNLEGGTVTIERSVAITDHGLEVKATKTHAVRDVDLGASVVATLRAHRAAVAERAAWARVEVGREGFVFSREPDCSAPLHPDAVTAAWRRACATAKVSARLHDLRHLNATLQLAAGVPLNTVSERLGHERVSTTLDIYGHAMPGSGAAAAATLDRLLGSEAPSIAGG